MIFKVGKQYQGQDLSSSNTENNSTKRLFKVGKEFQTPPAEPVREYGTFYSPVSNETYSGVRKDVFSYRINPEIKPSPITPENPAYGISSAYIKTPPEQIYQPQTTTAGISTIPIGEKRIAPAVNYFRNIDEQMTEGGKKVAEAIVSYTKKLPVSAKIGATLTGIAGFAQGVLSPMTSFFQEAEKIPVIGGLAYPTNLAFGEVGKIGSKTIDKGLDIAIKMGAPKETIENLRSGSEELAALAAQMLFVKSITPAWRGEKKEVKPIEEWKTEDYIKNFQKQIAMQIGSKNAEAKKIIENIDLTNAKSIQGAKNIIKGSLPLNMFNDNLIQAAIDRWTITYETNMKILQANRKPSISGIFINAKQNKEKADFIKRNPSLKKGALLIPAERFYGLVKKYGRTNADIILRGAIITDMRENPTKYNLVFSSIEEPLQAKKPTETALILPEEKETALILPEEKETALILSEKTITNLISKKLEKKPEVKKKRAEIKIITKIKPLAKETRKYSWESLKREGKLFKGGKLTSEGRIAYLRYIIEKNPLDIKEIKYIIGLLPFPKKGMQGMTQVEWQKALNMADKVYIVNRSKVLFKGKFSDFYNQFIKGIKEVKPEVKAEVKPITRPEIKITMRKMPSMIKGVENGEYKETEVKPEVKPTEAKSIQTPSEIKQAKKEITTPKEEPSSTLENTQLKSRVFERLKAENPSLLEGELKYTPIKLEKEAQKAIDLITTDKQKAFNVAMGKETLSDITSTMVNITMAEKALADGNYSLYARLVKHRSLQQTRRGQELVSERGSITNNDTSRYVKELIASRLDKLGKKYFVGLKISDKEKAIKVIDEKVTKIEEQIKNKRLNVKTAIELLDKITCI